MSPTPVIFLSAVSRELKSARQLVANTLTLLGYEPDWQDIFGSDEGDLRAMLRRRIDASAGVVQLVGHCYGAEPATPDPTFGRVSYTQYEALYAHQQGKRVWYLLLDDAFPDDAPEPEPEELRALQAAYRERVRTGGDLYYPLKSTEGLEASVLKLRDDLAKLRRGVKRYAALVLLLLFASVALGLWIVRRSQKTEVKLVEVQDKLIERSQETEGKLIEVQSKLDQLLNRGVAEYRQEEARVREQGPQKPAEIEQRTYEQLAQRLGVDAKKLAAELPTFAAKLQADPQTDTYARANAAYVAKDYAETGRLALAAAAEALAATPPRKTDAIRAYELAGLAAENRIEYDQASAHFHAAEKLTDRAGDPLEWARVQSALASVTHDQGDYRQTEALLRPVLEERLRLLGPEHPDTLVSRHHMARALWSQGRAVEAEREYRQIIPLSERLLGPEHPQTLRGRNNLANALLAQGKSAEAEQGYRAVLAIQERVLGPEHPSTLMSRMNLASALYRQRKYAEAENEYRVNTTAKARVLGPEHPDTLDSRMGVALALKARGKYVEAEQEHRAVLTLKERVLGPEHPSTLLSRNNLATTLRDQRKYGEAEQEHQAVLAIQERVLGPDHPSVIASYSNLALVLEAQKKYPEALDFAQRAERGSRKALGADHPDSKYDTAVRKRIEAEVQKQKTKRR